MTSNDSPVRALAQFFDDIRVEITGKLILIGQYQNQLVLHPENPVPLDRLSVLITMRWPRGYHPKKVSLKAFLSGQPPIVQDLPPIQEAEFGDKPISPFSGVTAQMLLNCWFLPLRGGDFFDVWAIVDDVDIPAGRLEVILASETTFPSHNLVVA
jgi:hypothetical protein